jgi:hypothetical protein
VGLTTVWDTAADAREFLDAANSITIAAAGPGAIVQLGLRPTTVYLGFGACDGEIADALGG